MLEGNLTTSPAPRAISEAGPKGKEFRPIEAVKAKARALTAKGKELIDRLKIKADSNPAKVLGVIGGGELQEKNLTQEVATGTKPNEVISKAVAHSQTPDVSPIEQAKKELFDQKTISKKHDQEGRDALASDIKAIRKDLENLKKEGVETEEQIKDRQGKLIVRLKQKLKKPDEQLIQLQAKQLEAQAKQDNLPKPREMLKAYYEKMSSVPLSNQEKRDLLKPEVLSELSTDEYIALWKRLNPYFLSHVTRQGFRDHNAMVYHSGGLQEFHSGFEGVMKDEKLLRPPLALHGFKSRDEASVRTTLNEWVLQAESETVAKERFDNLLHWSLAEAPTYPDKTAVHLASQIVADDYYGGEEGNEVFFAFPVDVVASQHNFAMNGWYKDFTAARNERKWNDVFVWPNSLENPGVSVDAGVVFLPEKTGVDPDTGSKYASEIKVVDGKEKRVMVENTELISKFMDWTKGLNSESDLIKLAKDYYNERGDYRQRSLSAQLDNGCRVELQKLGFTEDGITNLLPALTGDLMIWGADATQKKYQEAIDGSSARYKRAENTIPAKEYWEDYFSKNPGQKPQHLIFYDGDPTSAIYRFQQENGIGSADTSKTEGELLGFDDHHVTDMREDPLTNVGHQELVDLGNKIITEHYNQEKNS